MKKLLLLVICAIFNASMVQANENQSIPPNTNIWTDDPLSFLDFVRTIPGTVCDDTLKEELRNELKSRYAGKARAVSLQHAADTIALLCSIVHLSLEIKRLEKVTARLEDSIVRLEHSIVRLEHSANRLTDLAQSAPQSDRTKHEADIAQNITDIALNRKDITSLRSDVSQIRRDITKINGTLKNPVDGLFATFDAARKLAIEEDETIIATLDPKTQAEWLKRLIGGDRSTN